MKIKIPTVTLSLNANAIYTLVDETVKDMIIYSLRRFDKHSDVMRIDPAIFAELTDHIQEAVMTGLDNLFIFPENPTEEEVISDETA